MGKSYVPKEKVFKVCALPSCGEIFPTAKERQRFCNDGCRLKFTKLVSTFARCPYCGGDLLGG